MLKLQSRWWWGAISGVVFAVFLPGQPYAQQYPSQDIHFICGYPAGSGADVLVRYFAEKLRPILNRTIIVENKAGAGGNIGVEYAAKSKPDGYVVFVHAGSQLSSGMYLFKNPPVDNATAFQTVSLINRQPFMLVVDPKKPWKNVAELTAYLKAKGDKATYATSAPLGTVMGEMYKQLAGVQSIEVNYRQGSDALNDMTSGAIDYGMLDPVYALSQAREGRLRILAVSTGQRLEANPDLPTMAESGVKGMDLMGWFGSFVPAGTPKPIVDQLNKAFNQVEGSDETKKFLNSFGGDPWIASPDEAQAHLVSQIKAWADYMKIAKIQPQG